MAETSRTSPTSVPDPAPPQPAPRPAPAPAAAAAPPLAAKPAGVAAPPQAPRNADRPAPVPAELPAEMDGEPQSRGNFLLFAAIPSWLTSLVLHFIALLVLALLSIELTKPSFDNDLTLGTPDVVNDDLELFEDEVTNGVDISLDAVAADAPVMETPEIIAEELALSESPDFEAAPLRMELSPIGFEAAEAADLMQELGSFMGRGLEGRSAAERARLVREAGGTEGSEQAVKRALLWLQRHQNPDGSWSFFHLAGRCNCPGHGSLAEARVGATSIALLPFLGAGNTHLSGNFQQVVNRGLYFLLSHQKPNGSLWEEGGQMYSHGLASIVLCEAFAMTQDKALRRPAQASLEFITFAQDPITFGWRYKPRDMTGGDTSVVGWQLMALKSGHMASLYVNPATVAGAKKFLDSVQANDGATYGYMAPGEKGATSAIGLLCRMYLGWDREHPALQEGVERIGKSGPSDVNMYYNYYATQVMRHYEGEPWEKWNGKMRDWLVKQQDRKGHRDGSWYMGKEHTDKGGRLYCTAMATMILEVYYRHMPIYRKKAAEQEFEL